MYLRNGPPRPSNTSRTVRPEGQPPPRFESATSIACEDFFQRGSFGRVGPVINQKAELTVLFHDIALPMNDEDHGEVFGDREVAIVALADQPGQNALAVSERWIGAEIAGAANRAIAQFPPVSGDTPGWDVIGCWHRDRRFGARMMVQVSEDTRLHHSGQGKRYVS